MSEHIIKITARFVHAESGDPLTGDGLKVRFLDRDALKDDLLGESPLSADGRAEVLTTTSSFRSGLMGSLGSALGESKPDVYCEVLEGESAIYRTCVAWNIDPEAVDPVTKRINRVIDLGTFKFRRGDGLNDGQTPGEQAMRAQF